MCLYYARFDMNMNQTQPDTAERQVYEVELNVEVSFLQIHYFHM